MLLKKFYFLFKAEYIAHNAFDKIYRNVSSALFSDYDFILFFEVLKNISSF